MERLTTLIREARFSIISIRKNTVILSKINKINYIDIMCYPHYIDLAALPSYKEVDLP
jgi:hypothetical protein